VRGRRPDVSSVSINGKEKKGKTNDIIKVEGKDGIFS